MFIWLCFFLFFSGVGSLKTSWDYQVGGNQTLSSAWSNCVRSILETDKAKVPKSGKTSGKRPDVHLECNIHLNGGIHKFANSIYKPLNSTGISYLLFLSLPHAYGHASSISSILINVIGKDDIIQGVDMGNLGAKGFQVSPSPQMGFVGIDSSQASDVLLHLSFSRVSITGFGYDRSLVQRAQDALPYSGGCLLAKGNSTTKNAQVSLVNVSFSHCSVFANYPDGRGGAVTLINTRESLIYGADFRYNQAKHGGAFAALDSVFFTLSHTTFVNNCAGTENAGAVLISACTNSLLTKCLFRANNAEVQAGAMYLYTPTNVSLTHSTFLDNTAMTGGAISLYATIPPFIFDCVFRNNRAIKYGGAMDITLDTIRISAQIENTAFENNIALRTRSVNSGTGGAISMTVVNNASLAFINSTFTNNTATQAGGAIGISSQSLQAFVSLMIFGTKFIANSAFVDGGAIFIDTYIPASIFIVNSSSLIGNVAGSGNGGGVNISPQKSLLHIKNSVMTQNVAGLNGGGVWLAPYSTLEVRHSKFQSNAVRGTTSSSFNSQQMLLGGCIFLSTHCLANIFATSFADNSASQGGVLYLNISNQLTLEDVTFIGNSGSLQGGVLVASVLNVITASKIHAHDNICAGDGIRGASNSVFGGGVFTLINLNALTLESSVLAANRARGGGGGAISSNTQNWVTVQDTVFRNNEARGGDGGAVNVGEQAARVMFFNCTFLGNKALTSNCGALSIGSYSSALIAAVRFEGNTATMKGGGLCIVGSKDVLVRRSSFHKNVASSAAAGSGGDGLGGAIYLTLDVNTIITGCNLYNNTATLGSAIFINSLSAFPPTLTGNYFAYNQATGAGTVLWLSSSSLSAEPIGLTNADVDDAANPTKITQSFLLPPDAVDPLSPCPPVHLDLSSPPQQYQNDSNICTFEAAGPLTIGSSVVCSGNYSLNNANNYGMSIAVELGNFIMVMEDGAYRFCPSVIIDGKVR